MATFMSLLAARESGGGACPGRYLPVSTPWASGDQTIWEMPVAAHSPNSSASGARHSIEYWGWEETNNSGPARSIAAWSCSVVHSLKPRYRALPERTTCWKAWIVSSTSGSSDAPGRGRRSRSAGDASEASICLPIWAADRPRSAGSSDIWPHTLVAST